MAVCTSPMRRPDKPSRTACAEASTAWPCRVGEEDARGDVSAPNPMAVASLFIAAIHSLAIFEMRGTWPGSAPWRRPHRCFVAILWTGLAPKVT